MTERSLTQADIDAIVDGLEARIESKFYSNVGKGVWGLVWKAAIVVMLFVAAYGIAGQRGH